MNLGMLKLYKILLICFVLIGFSSCSIKDENQTKEQRVTKQPSPQVEKKVIPAPKKIQKPTPKKVTVKKKIVKKEQPPKTVVTLMPKTIVELVETKKELPKPKTKIVPKTQPKLPKTKKIAVEQKQKKKPVKKVISEKKQKKSVVKKSTTLKKQNLKEFSFDMIKKGKTDDNTLLVVGGIQGDEPGGFMAASLLSTHYTITKGSVWIVPNLNFYSILKRSRGPFGDMNRKFAKLSKSDPEYDIIQRIKGYITDPHVKLILNLHDGSGFYRPMYIDKNHNPNKWGQSLVIDQEILHNVEKYNDTYTIAKEVVDYLNKHLLKKEDRYRVKNTHTRFGKTYEEKEMAKTLTYFAVKHNKAAFGHETSKSLNVSQRVYYKLLALEKYMDIMGIKYKRKFKLTVNGIKHAMDDDVNVILNDTHIKVPLKDLRNIQKYFPIKKDGVINYISDNPLVRIIKQGNTYVVYYGNRRMTRLEADYSEHLYFDTKIDFVVDGKPKKVKFGETVEVKKEFLVTNQKDFRVNVIGYKTKSGLETNKHIYRHQFIKRYSLEKNGKMFRVEFYKNEKFAGMILIKYLN